MFLADASVRKPIAVTAFVLALLLFGVKEFLTLGVDSFPRVEVPFITIVTVDPGSTPEEIEKGVARKLEDALTSLDGLKHMTTVCRDSVVQILLEFDPDVDLDVAAFDVREKVDTVRADLPSTAEDPKILKFDVNAKAVITMALTGNLPLDQLYDLADRRIRDRFTVLLGVADVQLLGGSKREVEVRLDRRKMAAAGLTVLDVVKAVRQGQAKIPAGRVKEGTREFSVVVDFEARAVSDLERIVVKDLRGKRVRLGDIARVRLGHEERRQLAFLDGKPCIGLRVVKKSEANAVKVVERVKKAFRQVRAELPAGARLVWVTDDGDFIQASVNDAFVNILVGVLLTAGILFLFLHDLRSTIIAALTMPLSVVVTFAVMGWLGYTFNTSTLLGIGISVGILVANSIVVLESILKRREEGLDSGESARRGTAEVALAVLASAGTNVVVFVPIGMMRSIVGKYFGPFAITVAAATAVSLFVSFTVTPMLSAFLFRKPPGRPGLLGRAWDLVYGRVERAYGATIRGTRRLYLPVILLSAGILAWSLSLGRGIHMDFVPEADQGKVLVQLEFSSSQNLEETARRTGMVEKKLLDLPGLEKRFVSVGRIEGILGQVSEGVYLSEITLVFPPKTKRGIGIQEIRDRIRRKLSGLEGCLVSVALPATIGGSTKPLEMEISGDDLAEVERLTRRAVKEAKRVPGLADVDSNVRVGRPEIRVHPDRAALADLGIPVSTFGMIFRGNLEGIKAGVYRRGDRSWDIRVKLDEEKGRGQVEVFSLPGPGGMPLPVGAFAEENLREARIQVLRGEKRRVGKVFANLEGGKALGEAADQLLEEIRKDGGLPPGYRVRFLGMHEKMEEASADFEDAGIVAVALTFLLLCAILESWLLPFLVLLTVPLAVVGMIWGLLLAGVNMNIFVMLAGVMLVGLVVNNAILMIDRAKQLMGEGLSARDAMERGAVERFRPIVMTSLAAALGMLPMALGKGLGSEFRAGMGIASLGGLLVSAFFSLYLVPSAWFLVHRK